MWFCTRDGLNRYDGYDFRVYRPIANDSNSIRSIICRDICEDTEGNLWVITDNCILSRLDRRSEKFKNFQIQHKDVGACRENNPSLIYSSDDGFLWIATFQGRLYKFDIAREEFIHFSNVDKFTTVDRQLGPNVTSILRETDGTMFIGTNVSLLRVEPDGKTIAQVHFRDQRSSKPPGIVNYLLKDREGRLWAATGDGLARYDRARDTLLIVADPRKQLGLQLNRFVKFVGQIDDGNLVVGTEYKLLCFDIARQKLFELEVDNREGNAELSQPLSIYVDRRQTIWHGSESGLEVYTKKREIFTSYRYERQSKVTVRSICELDDTTVFVGTNNGVYEVNRHNPASMRQRPDLIGYCDPTERPVNAMLQDSSGIVWIGRTSFSFQGYDRQNDRIVRIDCCAKATEFDGHVYSMFQNQGNSLWMGSNRGLFLYQSDSCSIRRFMFNAWDSSHTRYFVFGINADLDGNLWLATNRGLEIFDPINMRYLRSMRITEESSTPTESDPWSVVRDRNGTMWIGTYGSGLFRYLPESDSFAVYTQEDGLANNAVYGVVEDDRDNLWLSSNNGLTRFTPAGERFWRFDVSDGLIANEFYFGAYHKGHYSGSLYFGGPGGFCSFHPDSVRRPQLSFPLHITGLEVFNRLKYPELLNGDTVRLSYWENFITFRFAAIDFTFSGIKHYQCRLEGVDAGWKHLGERRTADYTNLEGGSYTFHIRAFNANSPWNREQIAITLQIEPPVWKTLSFRIAAASLIFGIAVLIVWRRLRSIRRQAALERRTVESELQSLRGQMNPHFIFNALNCIQHLVLRSDRALAYDHLSRFARLMRCTLENSRREMISLSRELEALRLYIELEVLRCDGQFSYSLEVDRSINQSRQTVPTLLLQPYVENAIIHGLKPRGQGGVLLISAQANGDGIEFSIEDNGVGRKAAAEARRRRSRKHHSMGMQVARERLEFLSEKWQRPFSVDVEDLVNNQGQVGGTRVVIRIPLENELRSATVAQNN